MITIDERGRIEFSLVQPGAARVEVVGAFAGWHEVRYPMDRDPGGMWRLVLDPGPGEYLFRYLIDGCRWSLDPSAHGLVSAPDGERKCRAWSPPPGQEPDELAA